MRGAYMKGARAAEQMQPMMSNPYKDVRKADGRLTWSRAFHTAWHDGWTDWKRQQDPVDQFYKDRGRAQL